MAENIEPIPVNVDAPKVEEIAPTLSLNGGVIDPLSKRQINMELPPLPSNYPVGVQPSLMIPTQKGVNNTSQVVNQMHNLTNNAYSLFRNPSYYGKERAYNADADGANFARYAAVPRVFEKYGFSPYRDNETMYNKEASWWDYFKRSTGQAFNLAGNAFSSMLPWNAWDGETSDLIAAKEMERAHAIGHDSRGGFGSFINNLTVDSGYTFGILAEMGVEEIVGWAGATLLAPFTAGESWVAKGAQTAEHVRRMKKAFNLMDKVSDISKSFNKSYQWMRGTDKLQDIYKYAKAGGGKLITAVTPESYKFIKGLSTGSLSVRQADNLLSLANVSKGFGAFYRDVRAYNAIIAESKMEGGSTELQVRDHLIDEYYAMNGKAPDQDALESIYIQAANAGRSTYYWNLPVLWMSNKIVFDKALKGFRPMNAFREELTRGIEGKLVFNEAWKKAGTQAWEVANKSLGTTLKSLTKASTYKPKNLLKNGLSSFTKYSKANLTEGFQEMYQDAVSNTMLEYYSDRFHHPAVEGSRSVWGTFANNLQKTVTSAQGWETFASGFLMGSIVQVPQRVAFEWAPTQFSKLTNPQEYAAYKENMQKRTNDVVNALNAATMDEKFWDGITENTVQQLRNNKQAYEANKAGDQKAYYDIVDEDVFSHLHTLLKTGKMDLIKDHIEDLKGLDEKALIEAFGPIDATEGSTYDAYQKKLNSMLNKANGIEKWFNEVEEKFGQPFDPARVDKKKNPELYQQELNAYTAWEEAKKAAVFSKYGFERSLSRMNSIMNDLKKNPPVGESAASDFMMILNAQQLNTEISLLEGMPSQGSLGEIEIKRRGDAKSKAEAEVLQQKLDKLKEYRDAVEEYKVAAKVESLRDSNVESKEVSEADHAASITKGSKVRNKKGNVATVDKKKGRYAYDKNGNRIGLLKDLEIVDQKEGVEETTQLGEATRNLEEKFHDLVKHLAKSKDTYASDANIESAFNKLKDYYRLNEDANNMADAVDVLHSPERFSQYAHRVKDIVAEVYRQKQEKIRKAYEEFLTQRHKNELLNELYNIGVFLDEKGIEDVLEHRLPSDFYDIASKERIDEDSPKYKEIVELFEKYEATSNIKFDEKPIPEFEVTEDLLRYTGVNRNKINNDVRSFQDLAAQYGFDKNTGGISRVNTREVLKKIIASKYATYREKALARRLLSAVSKDSVITFGKLSKPGEFRYNKEAKTGIFIDARYTSHDYRGGKRMALEALMMHEILHEITSYEMETDKEFKQAVSKLLNEAKKAYEKNRPTDETLYRQGTEAPFYGLKDEHEFVAELFTNDRFASWLKTIPYETTGRSLWDEFLDTLKRFFQRILGVSADNTLLDEAMYIVTSHIDSLKGGEVAKETPVAKEKEAPKGFLSTNSSIQDFAAAGVLDTMIQEYRKFVEQQQDMTATGWEADPQALDKSNVEIADSTGFRAYLNLNPGPITKILDAHNGKPVTPSTPVTETKGKEMANRATKKVLVEELGYNWDEVNKLTQDEAQAIIDRGLTKREQTEEEKIIKEAEAAAIQEEKDFFMEQVQEQINAAETMGEINDVLYRVAQSMMTDPLMIDTDLIEYMVEERKRSLAMNITFDKIVENETVIMKDGSKMIVSKKTKDTLYLRKKPGGKAFLVKAEQVKDKILYRDQPYMEKLNVNPPVTPEAQKNANINNKKAQEMNSIESIAEDVNEVKGKTVEEVEDDFENSIGCE